MLLRHLRYLLAVAEHRNFTRAAEALHVSQPTLSQQVRQLEEQLRVQLLDRSGRSVRPTDAGELYLLHARRALRELEAAQRAIHEVRDLSRGRLRLGMTPTFTCYLVGALVDPFNQRYPGIELSLEELPQDALEAALIDDRLDLGVAFSEPGSVEIDSQPLYLERLGLVLGRNTRRRTRRWPPQRWRSCRWRCCATTSPRAGTSTLTCASKGDGAGGAGGELDQRHRRRGSPRKTGQHPAGGGGAPAGRVALRGAAAGVADPPGSAVLAPGQPPRCRAPGLPGPGAGTRRRAGRRLSGISRDSAATPRVPHGAAARPGRRRTGRAGR